MVPDERIELPIFDLQNRCTTAVLIRQTVETGGMDENRTHINDFADRHITTLSPNQRLIEKLLYIYKTVHQNLLLLIQKV